MKPVYVVVKSPLGNQHICFEVLSLERECAGQSVGGSSPSRIRALETFGEPDGRRDLDRDPVSAAAVVVGDIPPPALADANRPVLMRPEDATVVESIPMESQIWDVVAASPGQILVRVAYCLRLLALEVQ